MRAVVSCILSMAAATRVAAVEPALEEPQPPDGFVVTTAAGQRLVGGPARIMIRFTDPTAPPVVEVAFSATDQAGRRWAAHVMATPALLATRSLSAMVVDRPLQAGEAAVEFERDGTEPAFATTGRLRLALRQGRLDGEADGMAEIMAARFAGPFVASCAIPPAAAMVTAPASADAPPALMVDNDFASPLCAPFRRLNES